MAEFPRSRAQLVSSLLILLAAAFVSFVLLVELAQQTALFFGGILAAVALTALAELLRFRGRLPYALGLGATLALLVLLAGGLVWWIAPQLAPQFEELATRVPRGLSEARRWFESSALGQRLSSDLPTLGEAVPGAKALIQSTGQVVGSSFSALADLLILSIFAIFLAASPQRYAGGAVKLLPSRHRRHGEEVLAAMAGALRRWLLARAALMLLIALLLAAGLLLLGVPLAVPLAILAGLFSFVPYVGPALALIPALAVGLLESPMHALYVLALYLGVQLLESYVVQPLVEARAIALPPALIILAQVISAVWLGPLGVVIATPLLVVVVVAVQLLYQREVLGDDVSVIGS